LDFLKTLSGKRIIEPNRKDESSARWLETLSRNISQFRSLFLHMSRRQVAGSANCWPNTASKFVGLPSRKISSPLRPITGDLTQRTSGLHITFYDCVQLYIGQTGRSVENRITERHRHERLGYPDKTAVGKHMFNHNYLIKFPRHPDSLYCTRLHGSTNQGGG